MIAVIDYDAGNIHSVLNCLKSLDADYRLTKSKSDIKDADGIILPGVGAFGYAAESLEGAGLLEVIKAEAKGGKPFFGICLGMQLMLNNSEESEGVCGLGLIEGGVTRLKSGGLKVPHIGWTSLDSKRGNLLDSTAENEFFYFVHSFGAHCLNRTDCAAQATYGEAFDAVIERGNLFGTQFHPEKSGGAGKKILSSFLEMCK